MTKVSMIALACLAGLVLIAAPVSAVAQTKAGAESQEKSVIESQFDRIKAVSAKSKTVNTAKGYSDVVVECDALLSEQLKKKSHRDYLRKLLGWALDQRGSARLVIAGQFRSIGNTAQADQILTQAVADFERSLESDSIRWQTYMHRGTMLAANEDYAKAEADFSKVVELNAGKVAARFNRAEMRYQLQRFEEAAEDYTAVLKTDANDVQSLSGRAHCLLELNNNTEALADYDRVVQLSPNDAWALANRADALLAESEWSKAKADLEQANTLRTNGDLMRRLAWLISTCSDESICDGKRALTLAKRAVELSGETSQSLDTLAAAFAADGQFDQARDVYSRAIALQLNVDPSSKVKQTAYENNERVPREVRSVTLDRKCCRRTLSIAQCDDG